MAFGKKSIERLPGMRSKMEANRIERLIHDTEVKMLKVPAPGTPLGDEHLLSAVELHVQTPGTTCSVCKEYKHDVVIRLTGSCKEYWDKKDL